MSDEEIKNSPVYAQLALTFGGSLNEAALIATAKTALNRMEPKEPKSGPGPGRRSGRRQEGFSLRQLSIQKEQVAKTRRTKEATQMDIIQENFLPGVLQDLKNFNEEYGNLDGARLIISLGKSDGQSEYSVKIEHYPSQPRVFSKSIIRGMVEKLVEQQKKEDSAPEESEEVNQDILVEAAAPK